MNSPRTLVLSIAATACGFILALVTVIGQASSAATPVVANQASSTVAVVAQEISQVESVPYMVAWQPTASHLARSR